LIKNKDITVWFSCGVASAVAAKISIDLYSENNRVRVVNNPVKEEHPDNHRFLKDVEKWIKKDIEFAVNDEYADCSAESVWKRVGYMSNRFGYATCTNHIKKYARQQWESENNSDFIILGFTAEEKKRAERFQANERNNLLTPLVDQNLTKQDCFEIISTANIEIPKIYKLRFPNANCIGCCKASSPTYWNLVRKHFPKIFEKRAKISRELGAKLVILKGERIFLDELLVDTKARDLKNYNFNQGRIDFSNTNIGGECGVFCEEPEINTTSEDYNN
tara:strand:- start:2541 stop:3368 length:828 start_codon:yes stop_codon:yes gene_type:complete